MPRVHVEAAGSSSEELLELGDRQSAILGRNPDPKTVDVQLDLAGARAVSVQSPSVSANHVAVWVRDHEVRLAIWGAATEAG